jgi:hypothetical protein
VFSTLENVVLRTLTASLRAVLITIARDKMLEAAALEMLTAMLAIIARLGFIVLDRLAMGKLVVMIICARITWLAIGLCLKMDSVCIIFLFLWERLLGCVLICLLKESRIFVLLELAPSLIQQIQSVPVQTYGTLQA